MYALMLARRTAGAWAPQIRQAACRSCVSFFHHQQWNAISPASLKHSLQANQYRPGFATRRRLFSTTDDDDAGGEWKVPNGLYIPEEKLEMSFVRSGGAGGQNVNKLSTQVQIKLLLDETTCHWIPAEVLERLKEQQRHRINNKNELTIAMQEYRTQLQNRKGAVDKLRDIILQAWPRPKIRKLRKGVSKQTKARYKEEKIIQSEKKKNRGKIDF